MLSTHHEFQGGVSIPSADGGRFTGIWYGDKDEEMLNKVKVGKNAKECFAEMSENGKIQNGLRSQMMQLDSPKQQKSIEKL